MAAPVGRTKLIMTKTRSFLLVCPLLAEFFVMINLEMSGRRGEQATASPAPELAGYTVTRLIGSGGFADVYLYGQTLPRRNVAIKVLIPDATDAEVINQFDAEANLMAALSTHPAIVTIYQAGVAPDGRPYLVMEYCSRPNLAARYRAERLSVAEVLRIGVRIAGAVETAHRAGILHRDIKPANVLTTDFGHPVLSDFGISVSRTFRAGPSAATVGMSIPWTAPEMFVEDAPATNAPTCTRWPPPSTRCWPADRPSTGPVPPIAPPT